MKKGAVSGGKAAPFVVIFTDLDGTLLDQNSYGWEEAKPALNFCRERHIPLVLVSSKTRGEMAALRQELGLSSPFISENGGGIFFPNEGAQPFPSHTVFERSLWKWSLGLPYDLLVKYLREIRNELGWRIRGFSDMTLEEISDLTGLDLPAARLASLREFDEPFIIMEHKDIDIGALREAAKGRGLNVTAGGRFYHLHGKTDKGEAVQRLIGWYIAYHPKVLSVALGDSPNDFGMLKRVTHPVLVRSSRDFHGLKNQIPGLRITQEKGPKGWNAAVLDVLRNEISFS